MPQGPIATTNVNVSKSLLNISTQTVVKTTKGTLITLIVTTAGSTVGTVNDCATVGAVAAGNLIFDIPETPGVYKIDFPCQTGLVVTPGTGQVVSIAYQ